MGCHTWFARPVTVDEFLFFKNHAIEDAWDIFVDTDSEFMNLEEYQKVKYSVQNETDYWWKKGYGTRVNGGNQSEHTYVIDGVWYLDLSGGRNRIFDNLKRYHDVFRVDNYPSKIIHNRKELRRFLRKKYFKLDEGQLEIISEFFKENPGGIITFG